MLPAQKQPLTLFIIWSHLVNTQTILSQATGNITNIYDNRIESLEMVNVCF